MKRSLLKLFAALSFWLFCTSAFAQYKPGELDLTFRAPAITGTVIKSIEVPDTRVVTRSIQDNGSMYIVGNFSKVGSKAFGGIAKLNADGSLDGTFGSDPTFKGAIGPNDTIYDCAFFSNSGFTDTTYLIVVGKFASFNGDTKAKNIAIIDQNGKIAVDMSRYQFDNTIYGIETYSNGNYYLYGKFGKPVVNKVTSNSSYLVTLSNLNVKFPALNLGNFYQQKGAGFTINGPVYTVVADPNGYGVFVGGRFSTPQRYIFRIGDDFNGQGNLFRDDSFLTYANVPDSTVREIQVHYNQQSFNYDLLIAGDFRNLSGAQGLPTKVAGLVRLNHLSSAGYVLDFNFKPVINAGAVNSITYDQDSLLVTGPTVVNGKSVGQLAFINNTSGAISNAFFPGKGFVNGNAFHSRSKNGGFFVSGNFTQYDGTNVSKIVKINGSVGRGYFEILNSQICEGDSLSISGDNLGTTQSVKWGTTSLPFKVINDYSVKAFIPVNTLKTGFSGEGIIEILTLYPLKAYTQLSDNVTIYKRPLAPTVSQPITNQTQIVPLGKNPKNGALRYLAPDKNPNVTLGLDFEGGSASQFPNRQDSVEVDYFPKWTGKANLALYYYIQSEGRVCESPKKNVEFIVYPSQLPKLVLTGQTNVQAGVIQQYEVIRKDTIGRDIDLVYDWFYVPKGYTGPNSTKYLYIPAGEAISDSAVAQFTFLNNTPEGEIMAIAKYLVSSGPDRYATVRTVRIPLKIAAASVSPTQCVDTLGCNSGYNITKVTIGDFVFDQKANLIDCFGNGYSDFTADVFSYTNSNGEFLEIPMQRQTVYTSGKLHIKIESEVPQYYALWIDLNNDNDFNDPQEFRMTTSKESLTCDARIIIPNYERSVGERKMRIRSSNSALTLPCTLIDNNQTTERGETEDYVITLAPYLSLESNQIITPNNDGSNEYLEIRGVDPSVPKQQLIIYDRFGKKVYENQNYDSEKWTGLDQDGKQLESGTYYFYFKNGERSLKNFVEILRDK